jgi:hypothetical protein
LVWSLAIGLESKFSNKYLHGIVMKHIAFFSVMTPCSLVCSQRFGGTYYLCLHFKLKDGGSIFVLTLAPTYQAARRYNTDDDRMDVYRRENIKSHHFMVEELGLYL